MTYKSKTKEFKKAFDAVQFAMSSGERVGIYKGDKLVRWLV
jgi:hypothetical protein